MIEVTQLVAKYGLVTAVDGVSFSVQRGEHLTLLGPSGCGKTTTLRCVAGLEDPATGTIVLDQRTVFSSAKRTNVGSERRGISMVFQSYAIWPHMTVFENVAYGLRVRRRPSAEVAAAVKDALHLVQMESFADRPASALSGGQQQRVALARAVAFKPNIILFDEPLSNLDAKLRAKMRLILRHLQRQIEFTSIYVTHDQEEALAISDRVIVMNKGRIEQMGTPDEIYNRPCSKFVADFVGSANLLPGRVRQNGSQSNAIVFEADGGWVLNATSIAAPTGKEDMVAVRTAHVRLSTERDESMNHAPGKIAERVFLGDFIEYVVAWKGGKLIARQPPTNVFDEGADIWLSFPADQCVLLAG